MASFNNQNKTYEEMVEEGKQRYESADLNKKMDILTSMGKLDREGNKYKSLTQALADRKPLTFVHIGTTGLRDGKNGEKADQLTQVSLVSTEYNKEKGIYEKTDSLSVLVKADADVVARAEQGTYDIFANGGFGIPSSRGGVGITAEQYKEGLNVKTPETTRDWVKKYLEGKDTLICEFNERFDSKFLTNAGINLYVSYDLRDIVPEYDYLCLNEGIGREINENEGKYSLENIMNNIGKGDMPLLSAESKCNAMIEITNEIGARTQTLERDKIINDKAVEYRDTKLMEYEAQYGNLANVPATKLNDIGVQGFKIMGDDLIPICEDATKEKINELATRFDKEFSDGAVRPMVAEEKVTEAPTPKTMKWEMDEKEEHIKVSGGNFTEVKEVAPNGFYKSSKESTSGGARTGNLYSDVQGAKADVVIGDVTKVGEVNIPHVSEALKEIEKPTAPELASIYKLMELQTQMIAQLIDEVKEIRKEMSVTKESPTILQRPLENNSRNDRGASIAPSMTKRTVDKTEKERAENPMKAMPHNVIAQDLKGHEFEEEEEIEMNFKGTTV